MNTLHGTIFLFTQSKMRLSFVLECPKEQSQQHISDNNSDDSWQNTHTYEFAYTNTHTLISNSSTQQSNRTNVTLRAQRTVRSQETCEAHTCTTLTPAHIATHVQPHSIILVLLQTVSLNLWLEGKKQFSTTQKLNK
ncbi:hypothetical protein GOODEAATRI_003312 [Goodea atripinnis]|uniref:Uncharacterized protein n=1 Tax=Goodea atripinnis TaxID=208336 RepID=A0ABV0MEP7_9TELE